MPIDPDRRREFAGDSFSKKVSYTVGYYVGYIRGRLVAFFSRT